MEIQLFIYHLFHQYSHIMYEYEFARIEIKGLVKLKPSPDYHTIVEEYAKQGWRLVQIFAAPTGAYGAVTYYELIFEKPKNNIPYNFGFFIK